MCDRLVGRIDQVDADVASMLDKWRSVEEGGKSLQDASQKLLDERVRPSSPLHLMGGIDNVDVFFSDRTNWWNFKGLLARLWNTSRS